MSTTFQLCCNNCVITLQSHLKRLSYWVYLVVHVHRGLPRCQKCAGLKRSESVWNKLSKIRNCKFWRRNCSWKRQMKKQTWVETASLASVNSSSALLTLSLSNCNLSALSRMLRRISWMWDVVDSCWLASRESSADNKEMLLEVGWFDKIEVKECTAI